MIDRRLSSRRAATGVRARVRTGQRLVVIDVSSGGALVEAAHPLRPGTALDVHFERDDRQGRCCAVVVRCAVVAISAHGGITYRAGLSFSDVCEWVCEEPTRFGCEIPAE